MDPDTDQRRQASYLYLTALPAAASENENSSRHVAGSSKAAGASISPLCHMFCVIIHCFGSGCIGKARDQVFVKRNMCLQCQKSELHRHTKAPLAEFLQPETRFHRITGDVAGSFAQSQSCLCITTYVDRFTLSLPAIQTPVLPQKKQRRPSSPVGWVTLTARCSDPRPWLELQRGDHEFDSNTGM